jgi:hypothetical protein
MTAGQAVGNAADTEVIAGYPSLSREAAGALKLVWRLANIEDDWTKGGRIHDAWDRWTYWPYMAKVTYNLTDTETYTALRAWCDRAWEPIYSDGEFAYGFNLGEAFPRGIINHIQGLSLVGGPGSAARMYNEPNLKKFDQPTLSGVDYPNLTVRQAYYDENRHALALAITPGQDSSPVGSPTSLRVSNLGDAQPMILEDGVKSDQWQVTGHGEIAIETTVDAHTFLVSLA